ncbi:MAG: hypothetical protein ACOX59_09565 [Bacteroidales bacterium]|jgi:uncharacterized protein YycO
MIKQKITNLKHKKTLISFLIIIIIIALMAIMEEIIEPMGFIRPDYDKTDISYILEKNILNEDDYKELFYQTGLGKTAVDEILKDKVSGKEKILKFQETFFKNINVSCKKIGIITSQESIVNNEGKPMYGFNLAPYHNGYILVTKATHSLGWRHGHAGIVTDAENRETLEAVILGTNTMLQDINKWRVYPSFMMLKLKDTSQETLNEIAQFAKNNMIDIPYGLTVGLTSKKNPAPDNIKSTQCSHVAWYPLMQFGYDVDYDGSWLVTPKDIANSDLFEIVQIYGVDPADIWP